MSRLANLPRADSAPIGRRGRLVRRMMVYGMLVLVAAIGIDFALFAREVMRTAPRVGPSADAIVVLTGGAERIKGAAALLQDGHASRLLISGVHPNTTPNEIAQSAGIGTQLLSCCIDFDHEATNTIENAEQARRWAERLEFASLIVVTSAYHMPRSMAELANAMPRVQLLPYPVVRQDLGLDRWYGKPSTVRLVVAEYVKYILARLRMNLQPSPGPDRIAGTL